MAKCRRIGRRWKRFRRGRKTANVVLNTAFGWPTIAVDTHIFRVCNRTQFAPGKNVEQVEEKLLKVVPNEFKVDCHHWLILHGRYTCIARKPRCGSCLIEDLCEYKEKSIFDMVGVRPSRQRAPTFGWIYFSHQSFQSLSFSDVMCFRFHSTSG